MFRNRFIGRIAVVTAVCSVGLARIVLGAEAHTLAPVHRLDVEIGEVAFTAVGQVNNAYPASAQFGYLPRITGLSGLFSAETEDESTAYFTFYKDATSVAARDNGPLTIIEREGTTTIYYNASPHATFADPDSFRSGQAIVVMNMTQQVNYDAIFNAFTVVDSNDVTAVNPFTKDGKSYVLARKNGKFRWAMAGHSNDTPPPSGHFAAYIVKVQGD